MTDERKPTALTAVTRANTAALLSEQRSNRSRKAYELRRDGKSWFEIAQAIGITELNARGLVATELAAAANAVTEGSRQELLAMELERLDALQNAHWANALLDVRVAEFVLKVMRERIDLLDLRKAVTEVTNNTLVVAGTSEEYVAALRAIASGGAG